MAADDPSRGSEVFRILLLADSLSFQGPQGIVSPEDNRLYPQVMATELSAIWKKPVHVHGSAREGWTARDAWWALTKDPLVYADWLPKAGAVVIGVGGMDQLPAMVPTYIRDSLPYIRPGSLRRRVRRLYRDLTPRGIESHRWCDPPTTSAGNRPLSDPNRAGGSGTPRRYPDSRHDPIALWGSGLPFTEVPCSGASIHARVGKQSAVQVLDLEELVTEERIKGGGNPDGMHWGWSTHQRVGSSLAHILMANLTR